MELANLIQHGTNVSITVSLSDLYDFGNVLIQKTKRELEQAVISDKSETYPSPDQVAKILDVDKSTLFRWNKKGYLCPIEVGGKRRYRMSDIRRILEGGR
jgi:hypothetical protein